MPHRPALHLAELAALWDAEPTPVVLCLLWEIHRLQSVIRRAQQVREMMRGPRGSLPDIVWVAFESELDAELWLTDKPTERQREKVRQWRERMDAERKREKKPPKRMDPNLTPLQRLFAEDRGEVP